MVRGREPEAPTRPHVHDVKTMQYYARHADRLVERYEQADVAQLQRRLVKAFEPNSKILELGSGSGRDAALMLTKGFDVFAVDGAQSMVKQAIRLHPELSGRLTRLSLPAALPYRGSSFDGVYALAVLMHLSRGGMRASIAEVCRVLRTGGRFFLSVPSARTDVDEHGRDGRGRLFTSLTALAWQDICQTCGLRRIRQWDDSDGLGRSGMRWRSFLFEKTEA